MKLVDDCPNCGAPVGDSTRCRYCGKAFQLTVPVVPKTPLGWTAEELEAAKQTEFQVVLTGVPKNKMRGVVKVLLELDGRGLRLSGPAKDLVDRAAKRPFTAVLVWQTADRGEADVLRMALEKAGASAENQGHQVAEGGDRVKLVPFLFKLARTAKRSTSGRATEAQGERLVGRVREVDVVHRRLRIDVAEQVRQP